MGFQLHGAQWRRVEGGELEECMRFALFRHHVRLDMWSKQGFRGAKVGLERAALDHAFEATTRRQREGVGMPDTGLEHGLPLRDLELKFAQVMRLAIAAHGGP